VEPSVSQSLDHVTRLSGAIGATLEALIAAFCRLDKSLSCCWEKGWLVGAVGIEPTYLISHFRSKIETLSAAISSAGTTDHRR